MAKPRVNTLSDSVNSADYGNHSASWAVNLGQTSTYWSIYFPSERKGMIHTSPETFSEEDVSQECLNIYKDQNLMLVFQT